MNNSMTLNEVCNRILLASSDPGLEKTSNLRLLQLLAYAPPGTTATSRVDKTGQSYMASVDVHSSFKSFSAKANGTTEAAAVKRVLEKLEDQLFRWRFGSGSGHSPKGSEQGVFGRSPLARSG